MKLNENCVKEIDVKILRVMCDIDDYQDFCSDLELLIKSSKDIDLIYRLYNLSINKSNSLIFHQFRNRKVKKFIDKYRDDLMLFLNNNCLHDYLSLMFSSCETDYPKDYEYMYKYIIDNKDGIDNIKKVLDKIIDLGFSKIYFCENYNFNNCKYNYTKSSEYVDFLDNIVIIPNYDEDIIKYKSYNSNYLIGLSYHKNSSNEYNLRKFSIKLNSLLFNSERLPSDLSVESTVNYLIKLSNVNISCKKTVKDIVDLDISIDDLLRQYEMTVKNIKNIDSVKERDSLKKILKNISSELNSLRKLSKSIENELIVNNDVEKDILEKEKKLYLQERKNSKHYFR